MTELGHIKIEKPNDSQEWPKELTEALELIADYAILQRFSVLCTVGLNLETKRLSVHFSPTSAHNPHLAAMCDDIAMLFEATARRLRQ
jgi:hypothetical protein